MKEPVDHVLRPRLPWRAATEPAITECGYDAQKVKTITREELMRRGKELGQQRTAMLTCMTCAQTAVRCKSWDDDPRLALQREIAWESPGFYSKSDERGHRLRDELLAISDLIAAHPDEFATIIARREWVERKQQRRPETEAKPRDPLDARREP